MACFSWKISKFSFIFGFCRNKKNVEKEVLDIGMDMLSYFLPSTSLYTLLLKMWL